MQTLSPVLSCELQLASLVDSLTVALVINGTMNAWSIDTWILLLLNSVSIPKNNRCLGFPWTSDPITGKISSLIVDQSVISWCFSGILPHKISGFVQKGFCFPIISTFQTLLLWIPMVHWGVYGVRGSNQCVVNWKFTDINMVCW